MLWSFVFNYKFFVSFKEQTALKNSSFFPKAKANGLWFILSTCTPRYKKKNHHIKIISKPQRLVFVPHLMKLQRNQYSQFTRVSFHFTCVTTVSTSALSNATGVQLRWGAWMHHQWIIINYHQVELCGWCNTDLGIALLTTADFFFFSFLRLCVNSW